MATTFTTPTLSWMHNGIKQIVAFANVDDAKLCFQALYSNGIAAHFSVPDGYKEIPLKHCEKEGLLSDKEMVALKAQLDKMTLVH